jgi:PAS domain-containing protein
MILLRRVPPPALVESQEVMRLLLGTSDSELEMEDSIASVSFEYLPKAALIVSIDETVEDINARAREIFGLARRQVIGQKLDSLIARLPENAEDPDEFELGGRALFESLERMRKSGCEDCHSTANVNCTRADDSLFACRVDIDGVPDVSGGVGGFLVFLVECSEERRMTSQLHDAREHVTRLQNQFIPSDVQGFIRDGRTDFAFQTKTICTVAVQIATFAAHLRQAGAIPFLERVRILWGKFGVLCAQHPPLVRQSEFSDTFVAVGGLFSADDPKVYAQAALDFSKDVLEEIQQNESELRVLIGITVGGPLLCGIAGTTQNTFIASGEEIEDAISLAELSSPNKILVSPSTKDLLPDVEFDPGGDPTRGYFVHMAVAEGGAKRMEVIQLGSQMASNLQDEESRLELPAIDDS